MSNIKNILENSTNACRYASGNTEELEDKPQSVWQRSAAVPVD